MIGQIANISTNNNVHAIFLLYFISIANINFTKMFFYAFHQTILLSIFHVIQYSIVSFRYDVHMMSYKFKAFTVHDRCLSYKYTIYIGVLHCAPGNTILE